MKEFPRNRGENRSTAEKCRIKLLGELRSRKRRPFLQVLSGSCPDILVVSAVPKENPPDHEPDFQQSFALGKNGVYLPWRGFCIRASSAEGARMSTLIVIPARL